MTEPTKAAMERASALLTAAPGAIPLWHTLGIELDRVDRIAREVESALNYPFTEQGKQRAITKLKELMLPDETDLLVTIFVESRGLDDCCDSAEALRQAADRLGLVIEVRRKGEG